MRSSLYCLAVAFSLLCAPAPSIAGEVTAELVKDINTEPVGGNGSAPRRFLRIGDAVYFSATTPATGMELFVSDGTGVQLVHDYAPGPVSSYPTVLGRAGDRLIVDADDGAQGEQVVALDPVSGARTILLSFANPTNPDFSRVRPVAQVGERVIFSVGSEARLWTTDGTAAGTARLLTVQTDLELASKICRLPGRVLFSVPSDSGATLWRSDGSVAGTVPFVTLNGEFSVFQSVAAGNECYFLFYNAGGWSLWRSDGSAANLVGAQPGASPRGLAVTPQRAFVTDSSTTQFRLWRSDSSVPVAIYPASFHQHGAVFAIGDRVLFLAPYDVNGAQYSGLFVSDGSAAGTQRLASPPGFPGDFYGVKMGVAGNALVLGGTLGVWRADPLAATITSLGYRLAMFESGDFAELGGVLIGAGTGSDGLYGEEVWRVDGTPAGTRLLHDVWQSNASAFWIFGNPTASAGSTLFFSDVIDYPGGGSGARFSLWRSDGTAAGTSALPRGSYDEGSVRALQRFGDGVFFRSTDNSGDRYYRADAQLAGANLVLAADAYTTLVGFGDGAGVLFSCSTPTRDLCVLRPGDSQPGIVAPGIEGGGGVVATAGHLGDVVLFYVSEAAPSRGLWRSDGTGPGTYRIAADIVAPYASASVVLGDRLLFGGCAYVGGECGLYASDGTAAAPTLLTPLPTSVRTITRFGDRVALLTAGQVGQLWISDGTAAGTELLRAFPSAGIAGPVALGGRVHFIVDSAADGGYYISDGTKAGTERIALPAQLLPISDFLVPLDDDTGVFRCFLPQTGGELCAVDADGSRVRLVRDIFPGPDTSLMRLLGTTATAAYFAADDGSHGMELWSVQGRADALFADGFD